MQIGPTAPPSNRCHAHFQIGFGSAGIDGFDNPGWKPIFHTYSFPYWEVFCKNYFSGWQNEFAASARSRSSRERASRAGQRLGAGNRLDRALAGRSTAPNPTPRHETKFLPRKVCPRVLNLGTRATLTITMHGVYG